MEERDGKEHFKRLNKRLREMNSFDVPEDFSEEGFGETHNRSV